jgi:hypothetical protein
MFQAAFFRGKVPGTGWNVHESAIRRIKKYAGLLSVHILEEKDRFRVLLYNLLILKAIMSRPGSIVILSNLL